MKNIKLSFKILKQRMVIFALIFVALFAQAQVNSEGQVALRILITAIGVDKVDEGYEVSAQIFTPTKQSSSSKEVISEKGPTIGSVMEALIIKTGRLGIEDTCSLLVFGADLAKDNIMETIDYFLRKNVVSWSTIVTVGEKSALETLKGLNKLEKNSNIDWEDFLAISEKGFDRIAIQLRDFAKGIYGHSNTALCMVIGVEEQPEEASQGDSGSEQKGGGGSGGSSEEESSQSFKPQKEYIYTQSSDSQSSDKESKKGQAAQIKMDAKTAVFVKGQQVLELNREQTEGINWVDPKPQFHHFVLEGLGGYYFGDSKVTLQLFNKSTKIKSRFDDKPEITFMIRGKMTLVEVMRDQIPLIAGENYSGMLSKMLVEKTEEYIEKQVKDAYYAAAEKGADLFNIVKYFYKFNTKKYNSYMSSGRTIKDFLYDIDLKFKFKLEIEV